MAVYTINHLQCSDQGQVFHCKFSIIHSTLFSAFIFVPSYSPFIVMLSIIWYLLLPQTFFQFIIPSRASFSRQFFLSQWPSQFLFLFLISCSIILPSPTRSSTTAFFIFLSIIYTNIIISVLPKGRPFPAKSGPRLQFWPKAGLPLQTQEPRLQFY